MHLTVFDQSENNNQSRHNNICSAHALFQGGSWWSLLTSVYITVTMLSSCGALSQIKDGFSCLPFTPVSGLTGSSSPCKEFVLNDVIKLALRWGEGHKNTATHLHVSDLQHEESKAVEVSVWDD